MFHNEDGFMIFINLSLYVNIEESTPSKTHYLKKASIKASFLFIFVHNICKYVHPNTFTKVGLLNTSFSNQVHF